MADSGQSSGTTDDESEERSNGVRSSDERSTRDLSTEELREQVEAKYDFEDFGPAEMSEMTVEEWEAVFDADSWITGQDLLDRVERELRSNVHQREVFAVIERVGEGEDDRVVAYSDEGYVIVRPDGSIQGTGTILRDVEPMVALCSMESYTVPDVPDDAGLPHPDTVPEGSGDLGNKMLQVVAGSIAVAGLAFVLAWMASLVGFVELGFAGAIVLTLGIVFVITGVFLFLTVANARLSDRMRSEQYRDRLRAVGAGSDERPAFLPDEAFEAGGRQLEVAMERVHRDAVESVRSDER